MMLRVVASVICVSLALPAYGCKNCDEGGCDQSGCTGLECDGGRCNQMNSHNMTCAGGGCLQMGSSFPKCDGGGCDQTGATGAKCDGEGCKGTPDTSDDDDDDTPSFAAELPIALAEQDTIAFQPAVLLSDDPADYPDCPECQDAILHYQGVNEQAQADIAEVHAEANWKVERAQNATMEQIAAIQRHALQAEVTLKGHQAAVEQQTKSVVANASTKGAGLANDEPPSQEELQRTQESMNDLYSRTVQRTTDALQDVSSRAADNINRAQDRLKDATARIRDDEQRKVERINGKIARAKDNEQRAIVRYAGSSGSSDAPWTSWAQWSMAEDFARENSVLVFGSAGMLLAVVVGFVARRRSMAASDKNTPLLSEYA